HIEALPSVITSHHKHLSGSVTLGAEFSLSVKTQALTTHFMRVHNPPAHTPTHPHTHAHAHTCTHTHTHTHTHTPTHTLLLSFCPIRTTAGRGSECSQKTNHSNVRQLCQQI